MTLKPLPSSKSKYWKGADVQHHALKPVEACEHSFKQKGMEIECINCHMGLFLSPGDVLKKGHLYKGGKIVI